MREAVIRYHEAWRAIRAIDDLAGAGRYDLQRLEAHRAFWDRQLAAAAAAYRETVPVVAVARCPLTKVLVRLAIDVDGLDGPWWNFHEPCRPLPVAAPPTFLGYDGALRVTRSWVTPYSVRPGPDVPTVIPRLLASEHVHAVVSPITIGGDTGYITTYFADPASTPHPVPPNDWGTDHYLADGPDGQPLRVDSGEEARDPNLGAWLAGERCWWTAPGDDDLTLRRGADGCPYLQLTGHAEPQWLVEGRSSYASIGGR